jgi:GAF domain-containing protein/HAMP domain-containing protein
MVLITIGSLISILLLARNFRNFSLRTKVVIGILLTGGIALGILAFFAIVNTSKITNSLSQRLDSSVSLLAEEQLVNSAALESEHANQFFDDIKNDVERLAENQISLQSQKTILGQGIYWDSATKLTQLGSGQYGNSANDAASVFVPANTKLDESIFTELNTTAYLDFSTPQLLKANPSILAIYYIDPRGIVRYYPNIKLASVLPPDFDATKRPYYEITSPLFNPKRLTRWTIPYVDATGKGLVVTAASPVYLGSEFNGVVAADIQLSRVAEQISSIKVGKTGYAFMIDNAGRVITMPSAGFKLFGINPQTLKPEDFFKQTVIGEGSNELKALTSRMAAGGNGINIIHVDGIETYFSYAPINANGYSIALVVPVSEMQSVIVAAKAETQSQIRLSLLEAVLILVGLLFAAVIVSLAIGQVISAPVVRLTQTANQIVSGDLTAQAGIDSNDEIGILAHAFNTMTARLYETLSGLEKRVDNRTSELVLANERNERRAKQLQTITELSEAISQLQDLGEFFTNTTALISERFGFYHIGIFLIDNDREYAIMQAANSEGGQKMLARSHRLKMGIGVVGFTAQTGRPRIALNVGDDAVFFDNFDLPDTRSEAALPMKSRGETIGVLDVQSTEADAFSNEDLQVLTALANQVSIALENTRLLTEARTALAQVQEVYDEFTRAEWSRAAAKAEQAGFRYQTGRIEMMENSLNLPEVISAAQTGQIVTNRADKSAETRSTVAVPVKLRGEVIGILHIESNDPSKTWQNDEVSLVEAVAERAAFAMENARLFQDARRRASKERLISEATSKISGAFSVENILQTTAQELERVLGGSEVLIRFNQDK